MSYYEHMAIFSRSFPCSKSQGPISQANNGAGEARDVEPRRVPCSNRQRLLQQRQNTAKHWGHFIRIRFHELFCFSPLFLALRDLLVLPLDLDGGLSRRYRSARRPLLAEVLPESSR